MSSMLAIALGLALLPGVGFGSQNASDPEVERLIDKLVEFRQTGFAIHGMEAYSPSFLAIDPFIDLNHPNRRQELDPALKHLIQLGIRALPGLLAHVTDPRPTKATFTLTDTSESMVLWNAYEPRNRVGPVPKGVTFMQSAVPTRVVSSHRYTLRVGDICFVAVGQIVNRDQQSLDSGISSPVETPALAAAVRHDWSGLTADQFRRQLESDAYTFASSDPGAVERLLYYYPVDGKRVAIKLLRRPFYDQKAFLAFVNKRILATDDPRRWRQLQLLAGRKFGQVVTSLLPLQLDQTDGTVPGRQERAHRVLETLFPSFGAYRSRFCEVASLNDQLSLVDCLQAFKDGWLDDASYDVFLRADRDPRLQRDRFPLDELALSCSHRLAGKRQAGRLRAYFNRRVGELRRSPRKEVDRFLLVEMTKALKRSGPSTAKG